MADNVTPTQAKRLLDEDGYTYLDVRTVEEFEAGHVPGAYNVPVAFAGMVPNPDFLAVVSSAIPKHTKLVVGCKSGGRSARASQMLEANGYTAVNMDGGFHGRFGPMGDLAQAGWVAEGFDSTTDTEPGRDYATLKQSSHGS